MLETCCRPGEILSLQWQDVDLETRELTIRAEKAKTRRARGHTALKIFLDSPCRCGFGLTTRDVLDDSCRSP